jgi:hypothetical protein
VLLLLTEVLPLNNSLISGAVSAPAMTQPAPPLAPTVLFLTAAVLPLVLAVLATATLILDKSPAADPVDVGTGPA